MNNIMRSISKYALNTKKIINNNIYMIIGCYGIVAIILLCLAIKWVFHIQLEPIFIPNLPPAWQNNGDLNHILGTDNVGNDIFNYLLVSYKTTLVLTLRATFYVVIIGAIINYLLFFIPPLRVAVVIVFKLIISIPPLLSTIVVAVIWSNSINSILIIVGICYLPRFVHNIHNQIMQEWQKTYITAHRLDGLSVKKILNYYILPNIFPAYLTELVGLFSSIILALIILTFLGFGNNLITPDIGMRMNQTLGMIQINYWPFFSSGLVIILTIFFIQMLNFGVHMMLTKRIEN
ncbi:ABC transporter permease subunit [Orbus sturtevantii]|uniref:ABC transporter permease subunit n=1 Tax=Orbus sturtevantii TaxID=3074109 RepID=UPI00370DC06A